MVAAFRLSFAQIGHLRSLLVPPKCGGTKSLQAAHASPACDMSEKIIVGASTKFLPISKAMRPMGVEP